MADHAEPSAKAAKAAQVKAGPAEAKAGLRHEGLDGRPQALALAAAEEMLNARPALVAQRAAATAIQGRETIPRPIQRKAAQGSNRTGLPDKLKAGVETLSGLSMDDVKVHYGSSAPASVGAAAYARGSEIHVGPGQERYLPHEAWHVVQQKQKRVKPTLQKKGMKINDDGGLEREADVMGGRAVEAGTAFPIPDGDGPPARPRSAASPWAGTGIAQLGDGKASTTASASAATSAPTSIAMDTKSSTPAATDLPLYGSAPVEGRIFLVAVNNNGAGLILLVDQSKREKDQKAVTGHIEYGLKKVPNQVDELLLKNFAANPAGLGLGTILLAEFGAYAESLGIEIIKVELPALTAMGAYKEFGAGAWNPRMYGQDFKMYQSAYAAGDKAGARDFAHKEAMVLAEDAEKRAAFFNPKVTGGDVKKIRDEKYQAHMAKYGGDVDRAADLAASSRQLVFIPSALTRKAIAKMQGKWVKL